MPHLGYINSYSRPGESIIFIIIKDNTFSKDIPELWYQVRKKISDIRYMLPSNIESLTINDEFSDVYGSMYALTGDGFDNYALKKQAEIIRTKLLKTPDVAKVDFFGEQKQRIFIELSNVKLATIGISATELINILQTPNALVKGCMFESPKESIRIAVSNIYNTVEVLNEIRLRAKNQDFKLSEVSRVYRGYEDPPHDTVRYNGVDSLLLGVSMKQGGDVVALGHTLDKKSRIFNKACLWA